jgi:hypothetical protein
MNSIHSGEFPIPFDESVYFYDGVGQGWFLPFDIPVSIFLCHDINCGYEFEAVEYMKS